MNETQKKDMINKTKEEISRFLDLFLKIEVYLEKKDRVIVGIDGNSASGKTTLANALKDIYGVDVIHMDDFFLPKDLRSEKRLNEIGGNIHYERFIDEIVNNMDQEKLEYRKFDCSKMDYIEDKITALTKPMLIIEGVYSLHPKYTQIYDLKVFLSSQDEDQKSRILERSNHEKLDRYIKEWLPLEESYFKEFEINKTCDFIF